MKKSVLCLALLASMSGNAYAESSMNDTKDNIEKLGSYISDNKVVNTIKTVKDIVGTTQLGSETGVNIVKHTNEYTKSLQDAQFKAYGAYQYYKNIGNTAMANGYLKRAEKIDEVLNITTKAPNSTSSYVGKAIKGLDYLGKGLDVIGNYTEGIEDYSKYQHEGLGSQVAYGFIFPTAKTVGTFVNVDKLGLSAPINLALSKCKSKICKSTEIVVNSFANPIAQSVDTIKMTIDTDRKRNDIFDNYEEIAYQSLKGFYYNTQGLQGHIMNGIIDSDIYKKDDVFSVAKESDRIISLIIHQNRKRLDMYKYNLKSYESFASPFFEERLKFSFYPVPIPMSKSESDRMVRAGNLRSKLQEVIDNQEKYINELEQNKVILRDKIIENWYIYQETKGLVEIFDGVLFQNEQTQRNKIALNKISQKTQSNTSHFGSADSKFVGTKLTLELSERNRNRQTIQENPYLASGSTIVEAPADIVLNWGARPADLDSHLTGPLNANGGTFHTHFENRGSLNSSPNVLLYRDDTSHHAGGANRPEQTRINVTQPGKYNFYVHDFSNKDRANSTALSKSGAVVTLHSAGDRNLPEGNNLGHQVARFEVPTNRVGTVWHAFELDTRRNTVREIKDNNFYNAREPASVPKK